MLLLRAGFKHVPSQGVHGAAETCRAHLGFPCRVLTAPLPLFSLELLAKLRGKALNISSKMMLHFQAADTLPALFSEPPGWDTAVTQPWARTRCETRFLPVWVLPTGQPPLENSSNPAEPAKRHILKLPCYIQQWPPRKGIFSAFEWVPQTFNCSLCFYFIHPKHCLKLHFPIVHVLRSHSLC